MMRHTFCFIKKGDIDFLHKRKSNAGFTLIEVVLVLGISAILVFVGFSVYGNFQTRAQIRETSSQVVQAIRLAQIRAEAGLNDSNHGVYFDINPIGPDSYTIYQGDRYASRFSDRDQFFEMDDAIEFESLDIGGGGSIEINFSKHQGLPDETGSFRILHRVGGEKLISVGMLGQVEED